ncbi:MAG TPA: hypothetical protein VE081_14365 [Sporichthyaceae bacterium]|nr:hypothetical protein [Sporichthyaceae bacterium]
MWISTTQHRTRPALAGLVGATVLATGLLPTRAAHAAAKPPVVKIVLHGNNAKITGAKGLKAGWLTLRLSATDAGYHDLYLGSARNGDPGPGGKAAAGPQGIRKSSGKAPTSGQSQSQAAIYGRNAAAARTSERSALSLGGVRVTRARGVDLTVRLPAGTTVLFGEVGPLAELKASKGTNTSRPGGAHSTITEGADNVIHSPATLPRTGALRISNTCPGDTRVHWITLNRLANGTTKASVAKWFGPDGLSGPDPFLESPVTGSFNPLSAGHSEYVAYRGLSRGRYALIDTAVDETTGHVHAQDGSIRFITVK